MRNVPSVLTIAGSDSGGDVLLADDLTGRGHTTAVYGDKVRISVAIPVID